MMAVRSLTVGSPGRGPWCQIQKDARGPGRFSSSPIGSQVNGNPEGSGSFLKFELLGAKRFAGSPNVVDTLSRYRAAMAFRSSVSSPLHCPGKGYEGCRSVIARLSSGMSLGIVSCHIAGLVASHCGSARTLSSRCCTRWTHAVSAHTSQGLKTGHYVTLEHTLPEPSVGLWSIRERLCP